jgi:chromosome segregation ATPase
VIKERDDLKARVTSLESELAASKELIASLTYERDTLQGRLAESCQAAETNISLLKERTKERDDLAAEVKSLREKEYDFDKRVAAEVARLGIMAKAADVKSQAEKPLTATQKCLAALGVKVE